jgi:hypothetical protein
MKSIASGYQSVGRPDQDGRFNITGMPPGAYYIIAVDHVEPGHAADADFLESVISQATSFSLQEGESKTLKLQLKTTSSGYDPSRVL